MTNELVFLFLVQVLGCRGAYFISTDVSNWSNASRLCKVAAPPISSTPAGYYAGVSDIDISANEAVWIGYYTVVKVFEYVGCANFKDIIFQVGEQPKSLDIKRNPDMCFHRCNNSLFIGVSSSKCFCIENKLSGINNSTYKMTNCTTPCLHPPGIACGSEINDDIISIYRLNLTGDEVNQIKQNIVGYKYCLSVHLTNREFMWEDCKKILEVECYTGHDLLFMIHENGSWLGSANTCFQNRISPTRYKMSRKPQEFETTVWTGLIRSHIIHKYDEIKENMHGNVWYGFLTKTPENEYLLKFGIDISKRKVLCYKSTPSDSINHFIIIGAVTGLLIVIVSLAVFYKRRKSVKDKLQSPVFEHAVYSYPCVQISNISQQPNQNHAYFILEPPKIDIPFPGRTNDAAMHAKLETSYDSIITNSSGKQSDTDNVYNRLGTGNLWQGKESDSEYNRLGTGNLWQGKESDSEYNRLGTGNLWQGKESDSEYNRLGTGNLWQGKESDSEYNTLCTRKTGQRKQTDNVYNTLEIRNVHKDPAYASNNHHLQIDDKNKRY